MIPFKLDITEKNNSPSIRIEGELDIHHCAQLDDALSPLLSKNPTHIFFNLLNTSYIDSTGLGVIANAARNVAKHNGQIILISDKSQLKKVLELSGLHKKNVTLVENEKAAEKFYA